MALMSLFAGFMMAALLLQVFPLLGVVVSTASLPLLSLACMVVVREQTQVRGDSAHPAAALEALRAGGRRRWRPLLVLCALYATSMLLVLWWSGNVDNGSFARLVESMAPPRTATKQAQVEELLASDALVEGLWVRFGGVALLSVPFWHAPGLVWWGGQGAVQALFSSTLGIWRTRGAFALYLLTLTAAMFAVSALIGLVTLVTGVPMLLGVLVTVGGVAFAVLFYATLWFSFDDTFGASAG